MPRLLVSCLIDIYFLKIFLKIFQPKNASGIMLFRNNICGVCRYGGRYCTTIFPNIFEGNEGGHTGDIQDRLDIPDGALSDSRANRPGGHTDLAVYPGNAAM